MNLGVVAGEASGDLLGAGLLSALRKRDASLIAHGVGGSAMLAAGCDSLYTMERLSVMGLVEPLRRLPEILRMRRGLYQHFSQNPPDVFVGIDSPDFNLGLEQQLHQRGIRVIHYVSPSVWAWRQKRIFKIAKATDQVLTLFPFEADFYHRHQVPVRYVGHPLADRIPLQPDWHAARKKLNLDQSATYVGILPGSRSNELSYLADTFIRTAVRCQQLQPNVKFLAAVIHAGQLQALQQRCHAIAPDLPITFYTGLSHDVMAASNVLLVASGTATLEAMLYKRPMVIAYRMSPITYQLARYLVKVPYIGLPNLLAGALLVPEFIQNQATPEALSAALLSYITNPDAGQALVERFTALHLQLRCQADEQAADAVLRMAQAG